MQDFMIELYMSDHNVLKSRFSITFKRMPKRVRKEFFQFKCEESKKLFQKMTSSTSKFTSCFENNRNFENNSNSFFKKLNRTFHQCFKKVRIKTGNDRLHGEQSIQAKLKLKSELKVSLRITPVKSQRILQQLNWLK